MGVTKAAFFDLEKTIACNAVEQVIAKTMYQRGEVPLSTVLRAAYIYLKYDLGLIKDFDALKRYGCKNFIGRRASRDVQLVEDLFAEQLVHDIYPDAARHIRDFQREGAAVYIVSSTYDFIIAPFAKHLAVDGFFGVAREVKDDVCTGHITGTIPHQEHKASIVRAVAAERGLDLSACWAFGDSVNDRHMLEAVGHAVAVNPDRKLRQIAGKNGWTVAAWAIA
jgi:HAD superfamily hydrolase (TIGR01490 family)